MASFPPERKDVVTIASRPGERDLRDFTVDGELPEGIEGLPELDEIRHESDLVAAMKERGYRLTMVGGGAGGEDLRRFYFRKRE